MEAAALFSSVALVTAYLLPTSGNFSRTRERSWPETGQWSKQRGPRRAGLNRNSLLDPFHICNHPAHLGSIVWRAEPINAKTTLPQMPCPFNNNNTTPGWVDPISLDGTIISWNLHAK